MKKFKDYLSLTRQSSRPVFPLAFLMLITLLLSACAGESEAAAAYTVRQMAEVAAASQSEIPPLRYLSPEDEYFYEYLTNFYGLDTAHIVDGAVFYAGGMLASRYCERTEPKALPRPRTCLRITSTEGRPRFPATPRRNPQC